jgi:hypothetical protein
VKFPRFITQEEAIAHAEKQRDFVMEYGHISQQARWHDIISISLRTMESQSILVNPSIRHDFYERKQLNLGEMVNILIEEVEHFSGQEFK